MLVDLSSGQSFLLHLTKHWQNWTFETDSVVLDLFGKFWVSTCQVASKPSHLRSFYTFLSTNFNILSPNITISRLLNIIQIILYFPKQFSILSLFNTLKTLSRFDIWQMNPLRHIEVQWLWELYSMIMVEMSLRSHLFFLITLSSGYMIFW